MILAAHGDVSAQNLPVKVFYDSIQSTHAQILDVRTQEEYNTGYIAGTFLANWNDPTLFVERVQHLDKTKPVYVYCLSGVRSAAAAKKLKDLGFRTVFTLRKGIQAWRNEGMELESSKRVSSINLDSLLQSTDDDSLLLLNIGAPWCPPCKLMQPVIDRVQKTRPMINVIRVDAGEQHELARQLQAHQLPTFIIYQKGKEIWRKSGIVPESELLKHL